jgi:hypothetical protein
MSERRQTVKLVTEGLRAAAGGPLAAAERRAVNDWAPVLAFANAHFLAPALHSSLAEAGRLDDLPADVRDYLALLHRLNRDRNETLRRQIIELLGALNAVEVVPMLLKGGLALFLPVYADRAARMIRDVDILVPARQVGRTVDTLAQVGYEPIARYEAGHNAYGDFARPHDAGAVDLHIELVETPYLLPAAEAWRRARPIQAAAGASFAAPHPTDMALHHLLHAQIHFTANFYRGVLELRQLHEFASLVDRWPEIDWDAIWARLARHRLTVALESYALAARRLFGCRWPLPDPPSTGAAVHCGRCLVQLRRPLLARLGTPLANVRAAFAWHRMSHLYEGRQPLTFRRLRHVAQFLHKASARAAFGRVFRA